jgi:hypothetical protein
MLNFETEMIINLGDFFSLNQVHKKWILNKSNNQPNYDDDDCVELMIQSVNTDQKQMRQLESSFYPDATQVVEQFKQGREILSDQAIVELFSGSAINEEPTKSVS